jgi:hypothetical protein
MSTRSRCRTSAPTAPHRGTRAARSVTAASLSAAALHPGRLRSLVVGSGASTFLLQLGSRLKEWVEATDLEPYREADPRQIVADALTVIERYVLAERVREDYLSAYEGDRFVESMRYVRSYPTELPALGGAGWDRDALNLSYRARVKR